MAVECIFVDDYLFQISFELCNRVPLHFIVLLVGIVSMMNMHGLR